jgi:hypothetical protein
MNVPQRRKRQLPFTLLTSGAILVILICMPAVSGAAVPCGEWDLVPTPNVGNSVTRLTSVTALSPSDAWAAGYWRNEPSGSGPLVLRWDGSVWSETGLPGTGHLGTSPQTTGVDSAPGGDVWVVGYLTTSYPTHNLPLVLRRRGGTWDIVETVTLRPETEYPYGDRGGFLYDVAALAPDDIWAVGLAAGYGDASSTSVPLAVHWDGSSWTDVEVPLIANRHHELTDVVAIAPDDVWAVGDYRNIGGLFHGVTYHWDGTSWSHVYSPIEAIGQSGLEDIVAFDSDDVWAIGGDDAGAILMHWDGSQWSLAPPPPNTGGSLAVVGPNDLWASGWYGYFHWDGLAWTEVPAAVPGSSYVIRSGGMEIVGDCDIWCTGFWTLADGITSYTLAERLSGSPSTVSAALGCVPASGTVPFVTTFSATLTNTSFGLFRRLAGRIDVTTAAGGSYSNWRSGYTNVAAGSSYVTAWSQTIPALGSLLGPNVFRLVVEDVTPAPYNQPPYPAAGDTASDACTVTGIAP